jgi:thioredoxin 1
MTHSLIHDTTDATFETDVLKSTQPVLVDCWATWCGPCKAIAPLLEDVARAYEGRLKIVKINVDENRVIPAKLGVRGVPTLMLFKDGALTKTKVGAVTKAQLEALIGEQFATA